MIVTGITIAGHSYPTIPFDSSNEDHMERIMDLVGAMVMKTNNLAEITITDDEHQLIKKVTIEYGPAS